MAVHLDLSRYAQVLPRTGLPMSEGRLLKVVGLLLEAGGCAASIGDVYEVADSSHGCGTEAEVVGLRGDRTLLMPLGDTQGLRVGAVLRKVGHSGFVRVGRALLGRVVDGLGRPIDGKGEIPMTIERALHGVPRNPLVRRPVNTPFGTGVKVIDTLLTMGEGQRLGIFAGGGVGKSSLLGMVVRGAEADVAVVALIGERAREVEDFVNSILGQAGLARSVVVVATSSDPPLLRARGALYAATVADYFAGHGQRVLFVMDSLTRYAMARREIGLSVGEPPATKGYTPSVFASLPQLLERAGNSAGAGSITGLYTVLVEADDMGDPIADTARAALDGHVVLSRELSERGQFPSIDVLRSISRVMPAVSDPQAMAVAKRVRQTLATYAEASELLAVGAYRRGAIAEMDDALAQMPALTGFFAQELTETCSRERARQELAALVLREQTAEQAP